MSDGGDGWKGSLKGGIMHAASRSPGRRKEVARMAAKARWTTRPHWKLTLSDAVGRNVNASLELPNRVDSSLAPFRHRPVPRIEGYGS